MDGLSTAASIIAVVQLAGSVVSICYEYIGGVKNAPKDLKTITAELISLRNLLEQLVPLANEDVEGSARLKPLVDPDGPLDKCKAELIELEKKLKLADGWNWKAVGRALVWPLKESDVKKALVGIERTKSTLNLALTMDQTKLIRATRDDVTALTQSFEATQLDELSQKIYKWLSPPDPSANHQSACEKRQPETGMWCIGGDRFRKWKTDSHSFLWLHGIPGCGKTILCSTIIEDVLCHCKSDPALAVAYFYFDFNDIEKQKFRNLIHSLVAQFSLRSPNTPGALAALYSQNQDGRQQPTTRTLIRTLKNILGGFRHTYIILDALDECTQQDELLNFIKEVVQWKMDQLHVLATSRKERAIEECLTTCASGGIIDIDDENVDADIRIHIVERLQNDHRLMKWSPEVRAEIEETLVEGAHGMFRWVACQLDALRTCKKPTQLRNVLRSLPKTLDETYDRILLNIDEEDYEDVSKILQWLAFSARPVTLAEVAEVLAVDLNDGPRFDINQRLPDPLDILTICSSLVSTSVFRSYYSDEDVIELRLAHFSVKEYLTSERTRNGVSSRYSFDTKSAHMCILQTSLVYLLQFDELGFVDSGMIRYFPLADYAAQYWPVHAQIEGVTMSNALQQLILDFLQPESASYVNWIKKHEPWLPQSTDICFSPQPPLYYTSLFGLETVSRWLIDKGANVDAEGGEYGNALQAASLRGHEAIVELLLDNRADVNLGDGTYGNALHAASSEGHEAIVRLLLDKGANVNAESGKYGNALHTASLQRNEAIARLLLDKGANVNAEGGEYGNALQAASLGGNEAIVRLLLDRGANVNAEGGKYGNALQAASLRHNETIVRLLLDEGANINAKGGYHGNALQAASLGGDEAIVRLLLDKGANINAVGGQCGSALQAVSFRGNEAIVRLLLDKGANVNAEGGEYGNALQAASFHGNEAIVRLLLDKGANVNAEGGEYGNALQAAATMPPFFGDPKAVVLLLLEKGAEINVRGGRHGSALQAASSRGNGAVVRLLLENGADPQDVALDVDNSSCESSDEEH